MMMDINGEPISGADGELLGLRACVRGVVIDGERKDGNKAEVFVIVFVFVFVIVIVIVIVIDWERKKEQG